MILLLGHFLLLMVQLHIIVCCSSPLSVAQVTAVLQLCLPKTNNSVQIATRSTSMTMHFDAAAVSSALQSGCRRASIVHNESNFQPDVILSEA